MYSGCTTHFHCVLMSRCRSAGFTRRDVILRLARGRRFIYIMNSSTRDVCSFHKTGVSGVLGFAHACGSTQLFGLRRGCHSARAVIGTTGDLVTGGHSRVRGRMFSRGSGKRPVNIFTTCDSIRRKRVIAGGVTRLRTGSKCTCRSFTVLCHAGTRDHVFRRTLHGHDVPCHVCKKLSFCRQGRIGSIITCFHLTIGPRSRRTFGHIVGCPTQKVKGAALNGLARTTKHYRIDL